MWSVMALLFESPIIVTLYSTFIRFWGLDHSSSTIASMVALAWSSLLFGFWIVVCSSVSWVVALFAYSSLSFSALFFSCSRSALSSVGRLG